MNKIRARINADDFSPWEDSFNGVIQAIEAAKKKHHHLETLEPRLKPSPKTNRDKRSMSRTFLSISKINLHSAEQIADEELRHSESKRYAGPRITFYASMNPKISGRSRSTLSPEQESSQLNYLVKKKLTGNLVRDASIKYLEIIEEKAPTLDAKAYAIPRHLNLHKVERVRERKNDEQLGYLRRLKMLYSARK